MSMRERANQLPRNKRFLKLKGLLEKGILKAENDSTKMRKRKQQLKAIKNNKEIIAILLGEHKLIDLHEIPDIDTETTEAKKSHDAAKIVEDLNNPTEDDSTYVEYTVLAVKHAASVMSNERLPILFAKILNKSAQKELEKGNLDISAKLRAEADSILDDYISDRYPTEELSNMIRKSITDLISDGQIPVSKFISKYAAEIAKKEVHGKEPRPGAPGASGI